MPTPGLVRLRPKAARPDVLGADQAQPGEALLVAEAVLAHALLPMRLSLPAASRRIFSRWRHHRRAVRITNSSAIWRSPSHHSTGGIATLATRPESEE